jgi:hypothetical protein
VEKDRLIADGPRIQQWMHDRSGLPLQRDFHGIAREQSGVITAAFGYDTFQPSGCALHLCLDSPTAINRALLLRGFGTPFNQWNFTYLACIIQASNHKSLNMATRLGFEECGAIPGHLWYGVMYRQNCRWLWLPEIAK